MNINVVALVVVMIVIENIIRGMNQKCLVWPVLFWEPTTALWIRDNSIQYGFINVQA